MQLYTSILALIRFQPRKPQKFVTLKNSLPYTVTWLSSLITQFLSRGYHLLSHGYCRLVIAYYHIDIVYEHSNIVNFRTTVHKPQVCITCD